MRTRPSRPIRALMATAILGIGAMLFVPAEEAGSATLEAEPSSAVSPAVTQAPHDESAATADRAAQIAALKDQGPSGCLVDPAAIEDLRKRREDTDKKAELLAAKEIELKARERSLEEELKKLEVARLSLNQASGNLDKEHEERLSKLVETLETMSPKASAQVISTVDESLAVKAISRIGTVKLAKIMNVMEPGKSSRLSELLAGVARAKNAPLSHRERNSSPQGESVAANETKGGNANDGHHETPVSAPGAQTDGRKPGSQKGK